MHQIQIYDDKYQLPERWDELSNKEMTYLVKLTQNDVSIEQVKIYMLLYCLKAHVSRHRKIYGDQVRISVGKESENVSFRVRRKKYLLTPEEVCSLAHLFHFLVERETKDMVLLQNTISSRIVLSTPILLYVSGCKNSSVLMMVCTISHSNNSFICRPTGMPCGKIRKRSIIC